MDSSDPGKGSILTSQLMDNALGNFLKKITKTVIPTEVEGSDSTYFVELDSSIALRSTRNDIKLRKATFFSVILEK